MSPLLFWIHFLEMVAQDCYMRINETIEAAHRGRTPRVALAVLQDAAQKASQNLAKARLTEERAVAAYCRMTGV